mgnify:FL=1
MCRFNISNYLCTCILLISANLFSKDFPAKFDIKYELIHAKKNVGEIGVTFTETKGFYSLEATTYAAGILKLLGDRKLLSQGRIDKKGFKPNSFEFINVKKPSKNIKSKFLYNKNLITTNYKEQVIKKKLPSGILDLVVYLYQFNFIKTNNAIYNFTILEGKKVRIYRYKKLKQEAVKINKKFIQADLFEGSIIGRDSSTHYVWISKDNFRIPIKLKIQTDFGLLIEQNLISTSLQL